MCVYYTHPEHDLSRIEEQWLPGKGLIFHPAAYTDTSSFVPLKLEEPGEDGFAGSRIILGGSWPPHPRGSGNDRGKLPTGGGATCVPENSRASPDTQPSRLTQAHTVPLFLCTLCLCEVAGRGPKWDSGGINGLGLGTKQT